MNTLKKLWQLTGTRTAFLTTTLASLALQGYLLQRMADRYGLEQLTDTAPYYFGQLVMLAASTGGILVFYAGFAILNRFFPEPLPVDPQFPPAEIVYIQGDGEPEHCACHGKPIEDGAVVLHWPQPAKLVCTEKGRHRR